jgi:tRNA-dihydrouridine synthase A
MVTTGALIHGQKERFLRYDISEQPIALQLGGHDASDLATCAKMAEQWHYDEVNLNAGCPSDRVQNGMIGAILMAHSSKVKDGMKAMLDAVGIPVTIKHRIGIDDFDSYEFMRDFVGEVADSGCETFIVHARKAILQGLSPKENREIPPLDYQRVIKLKEDFPKLNIVINGGIKNHDTATELLSYGLDGVMLGREAYQNPLILHNVDSTYYQQEDHHKTAQELNEAILYWIEGKLSEGVPLKYLAKHTLGLYAGQPGSKRFRRHLSENMTQNASGIDVYKDALAMIKNPTFS